MSCPKERQCLYFWSLLVYARISLSVATSESSAELSCLRWDGCVLLYWLFGPCIQMTLIVLLCRLLCHTYCCGILFEALSKCNAVIHMYTGNIKDKYTFATQCRLPASAKKRVAAAFSPAVGWFAALAAVSSVILPPDARVSVPHDLVQLWPMFTW